MRNSIRHSRFAIRHSALTMVELLIVIVVIGILVSSILVAGSHLIGRSKERNTQSVLQVVADAVEEFKREQTANPTITRARQSKGPGVGDPSKTTITYSDRYGQYPPDELEVFTPRGIPGSIAPPQFRGLAPGDPTAVTVMPKPPYETMRFYTDRTDADFKEHRDLAAMILAIELYSDSARSMLDRIPDRNRSAGALNSAGNPAQFLNRNEGEVFDAGDEQISYILDDWGMPISYLAQRDFREETGYTPILSSNHPGWNEAATELIRMNGGQPVIFSYGANGKDQLTKDMMGDGSKASLVGDFEPLTPGPGDAKHVIDNPANADNVYSNPALKGKLAKGIQ